MGSNMLLLQFLSIQPIVNMLSPGQIMNTSFDPLDLVNTYGAFGTVGRERLNVVFEGTMDERFKRQSQLETLYLQRIACCFLTSIRRK